MLIGVCFGDNDFNLTVRAFLRVFVDSALVELHPESATKANVVRLWRSLAPGLYLAAQAGLDGTEYSTDEHAAAVASYVEERHVYLGQECLEKLTCDNNWAFSYVDTDTGEVHSS